MPPQDSPYAASFIRLRGVRHNNLKGFDLDLPLHQLIVFTGLSGSGKSSLAFDTLFAEGQRRYIETFSPYARQFFDRMDKPRVDSIAGIPPAIAIEQRNTVKTTRSTVGTMTEINDYLKLLWPHVARLHCRGCGRPVRRDSPPQIWETLRATAFPGAAGPDALNEASGRLELGWADDASDGRQQRSVPSTVLITFTLPLTERLSLEESLELIARQGYQRLWLANRPVRVEDALPALQATRPSTLTVIQDRLALEPGQRTRFVEACEQAYHFGKGKLTVHALAAGSVEPPGALSFSNRFHCAPCDLEYREPSPALFSFNHPLGACPTCRGFGRIISINYDRALPDRGRTLAQGVVKPWLTGQGRECQQDLLRFCRVRHVPTDVPFDRLPREWQEWVVQGDAGYGQDADHEWPRAWYGVRGYFRWLESKAYKMHVRVLLSRYRAYTDCPDCHGQRFQPESLLFKLSLADPEGTLAGPPPAPAPRPRRPAEDPAVPAPSILTLADFYALPVRDAKRVIEQVIARRARRPKDPIALVLKEVHARLDYLVEVGLGYLTLSRPTRSLSGGETERVNLTACLGTRLVNTLYVLDEPSVGLHPRDTARLVGVLQQLRDLGNTVVVVEHEPGVIRAANQIVDLGPGHGESGGRVVFQGTYPQILRAPQSLTGQYLAGRLKIPLPAWRPVDPRSGARLALSRARWHNLKDLTLDIPLGRLVCVTGVSGSGKTTLVRDLLFPALRAKLAAPENQPPSRQEGEDGTEEDGGAAETGAVKVSGWEQLGQVILVDQSPIGKTPRSNPAVYTGAFEDIRQVFARAEMASQRGLKASAFSFNSPEGQCERCRGAGFEKIEMQFLSDVFVRCPECDGRRYRAHILEVRVPRVHDQGKEAKDASIDAEDRGGWNIADVLEATVDEGLVFLGGLPESAPARRASAALQILQDVGLGYLRLGQPINTLSGGESQRLKLVGHLAAFARSGRPGMKPALFLFDEPTTGLHFDDVRVLLRVFQRLVDDGHSVLVIEHNLDVVKAADWVVDLGPEAGEEGGRLVVQGPPPVVAACRESHTGEALRQAGWFDVAGGSAPKF